MMDPFTNIISGYFNKEYGEDIFIPSIKTLVELTVGDYILDSSNTPVKIKSIEFKRGIGYMVKQDIGDIQLLHEDTMISVNGELKSIKNIKYDKIYLEKKFLNIKENLSSQIYRKSLKGEYDILHMRSSLAGALDSSEILDYAKNKIYKVSPSTPDESLKLTVIARALGMIAARKVKNMTSTVYISGSPLYPIPTLLRKMQISEKPVRTRIEIKNIGYIDYLEIKLDNENVKSEILLEDFTAVYIE